MILPVANLFTAIRPRKIRTMREFAEQEIILPPGGPRAGMRFRCDFAPWTGLLLDEFTAGRFRYFWVSGPVQDGKTTVALIIPLMYFLFEMNENVILGAPTMEIAYGKFSEEVVPMIARSNYKDMLPESGRGSRGGKADSIQFANGARIRFMAAGGSDAQRSAFPARIVFITEADKMDEPGEFSREADPVTQIIARSAAFVKSDSFLVFAECTMSRTTGRINQEISVKGTNTSIALRCPHCGSWVIPARENFKGWQEAQDVIEARDKSGYYCAECNHIWTEDERVKALEMPKFISEGQTIDKQGNIQGETKRTRTFGFRWNAMHSALKSQAFIGEKEFETARANNSNAQKELMQFTWALPYEEEPEDLSGIDVTTIVNKISKYPRGIVPQDAIYLTVAIDIGLKYCWWTVYAWMKDAQGFCIDYGKIIVPHFNIDNPDPAMILQGLRAFRNETLNFGWKKPDNNIVKPNLILVDAGYKTEITNAFVTESGREYLAAKGFGSKRDQERWHEPRPSKGKIIGNNWFVSVPSQRRKLLCFNSDKWKQEVHEGFRILFGAPGCLSIYNEGAVSHKDFAKQITAERRLEVYTPGKGVSIIWTRDSKANHYLDCSAMCRCAADKLGAHNITIPAVKKPIVVNAYEAKEKIIDNTNWKIGR